MDLKIGIVESPQVIEVELPDDTDRAALKSEIEAAMTGADNGTVLWLTDRKGRDLGMPAGRISFVQLGGEEDDKHIGFGA